MHTHMYTVYIPYYKLAYAVVLIILAFIIFMSVHSTIYRLNQGYCTSKLTTYVGVLKSISLFLYASNTHTYVYNAIAQDSMCTYVGDMLVCIYTCQ